MENMTTGSTRLDGLCLINVELVSRRRAFLEVHGNGEFPDHDIAYVCQSYGWLADTVRHEVSMRLGGEKRPAAVVMRPSSSSNSSAQAAGYFEGQWTSQRMNFHAVNLAITDVVFGAAAEAMSSRLIAAQPIAGPCRVLCHANSVHPGQNCRSQTASTKVSEHLRSPCPLAHQPQ
jgi:hypothetical protein